MTTPNIAFLDTETTSLARNRRIWEIGIILRRHRSVGKPEFEDKEYQYIIEDVDLFTANLQSLEIGGFFERHSRTGHVRGYKEAVAAEEIFRLLHKATIVGNVPSFDTEGLGHMLARNHMPDTWHYHLLDVENLIVGYLRGLQRAIQLGIIPNDEHGDASVLNPALSYNCQPPWNSEELSRLIGINPDNYSRHTALGDARWARDSYDRVMGIK